MAALGIPFLFLAITQENGDSSPQIAPWAFVILGAAALAFALLNVGIARARPVALRFDGFGVLGYYVPTLNWSEIKAVTTFHDPRSSWHSLSQATIIEVGPRLVFEVHDLHTLRMRQPNAWSRLKLLGSGVGVSASVLDGDFEHIVAIASQHHLANLGSGPSKPATGL